MVEALGQYKILERIGAGTLGDVYRARDTRLGRTVAVKLPGAELQADRARLDALSHDARVASALSHPNIAALYEIGDEGGRLFLVFEFVPGEPLKRVIAGRPLNVRRAVDLATQMADALAEAHALEIVHGDLTPDTVMVTPKGNAKILDFGFVQLEEERRTPDGESDHRTDIEALGALLFEMLTGRPPSEAASTARRLDAGRARRRRRQGTRRVRGGRLRSGRDAVRPNCDRSPRFWTSGGRRPIRRARRRYAATASRARGSVLRSSCVARGVCGPGGPGGCCGGRRAGRQACREQTLKVCTTSQAARSREFPPAAP